MSINEPAPQPVPVIMYAPVATAKPANGLGTAGMITGIIAVTTFWVPVFSLASPILAILGIVFGAIGLNRVKRGTATNRGVAKAGLICGITYWIVMGLVLAVIVYASVTQQGTTY